MPVIIRLQNLPWSANALDIRRFFFGLQVPDGGVHIVGGSDGDAFIAFSNDEDARRGMLLDGGRIGDCIVKLFLSSKNEMQNVIQVARITSLSKDNQSVEAESYPPEQGYDPNYDSDLPKINDAFSGSDNHKPRSQYDAGFQDNSEVWDMAGQRGRGLNQDTFAGSHSQPASNSSQMYGERGHYDTPKSAATYSQSPSSGAQNTSAMYSYPPPPQSMDRGDWSAAAAPGQRGQDYPQSSATDYEIGGKSSSLADTRTSAPSSQLPGINFGQPPPPPPPASSSAQVTSSQESSRGSTAFPVRTDVPPPTYQNTQTSLPDTRQDPKYGGQYKTPERDNQYPGYELPNLNLPPPGFGRGGPSPRSSSYDRDISPSDSGRGRAAGQTSLLGAAPPPSARWPDPAVSTSSDTSARQDYKDPATQGDAFSHQMTQPPPNYGPAGQKTSRFGPPVDQAYDDPRKERDSQSYGEEKKRPSRFDTAHSQEHKGDSYSSDRFDRNTSDRFDDPYKADQGYPPRYPPGPPDGSSKSRFGPPGGDGRGGPRASFDTPPPGYGPPTSYEDERDRTQSRFDQPPPPVGSRAPRYGSPTTGEGRGGPAPRFDKPPITSIQDQPSSSGVTTSREDRTSKPTSRFDQAVPPPILGSRGPPPSRFGPHGERTEGPQSDQSDGDERNKGKQRFDQPPPPFGRGGRGMIQSDSEQTPLLPPPMPPSNSKQTPLLPPPLPPSDSEYTPLLPPPVPPMGRSQGPPASFGNQSGQEDRGRAQTRFDKPPPVGRGFPPSRHESPSSSDESRRPPGFRQPPGGDRGPPGSVFESSSQYEDGLEDHAGYGASSEGFSSKFEFSPMDGGRGGPPRFPPPPSGEPLKFGKDGAPPRFGPPQAGFGPPPGMDGRRGPTRFGPPPGRGQEASPSLLGPPPTSGSEGSKGRPPNRLEGPPKSLLGDGPPESKRASYGGQPGPQFESKEQYDSYEDSYEEMGDIPQAFRDPPPTDKDTFMRGPPPPPFGGRGRSGMPGQFDDMRYPPPGFGGREASPMGRGKPPGAFGMRDSPHNDRASHDQYNEDMDTLPPAFGRDGKPGDHDGRQPPGPQSQYRSDLGESESYDEYGEYGEYGEQDSQFGYMDTERQHGSRKRPYDDIDHEGDMGGNFPPPPQGRRPALLATPDMAPSKRPAPDSLHGPPAIGKDMRPGDRNMDLKSVGQEDPDDRELYIYVANLPTDISYKEVRLFFYGSRVAMGGMKMINDKFGQRNGTSFIKFESEEDAVSALQHDGEMLGMNKILVSISMREEFDSAVDSYHPPRQPHNMSDDPTPNQNIPRGQQPFAPTDRHFETKMSDDNFHSFPNEPPPNFPPTSMLNQERGILGSPPRHLPPLQQGPDDFSPFQPGSAPLNQMQQKKPAPSLLDLPIRKPSPKRQTSPPRHSPSRHSASRHSSQDSRSSRYSPAPHEGGRGRSPRHSPPARRSPSRRSPPRGGRRSPPRRGPSPPRRGTSPPRRGTSPPFRISPTRLSSRVRSRSPVGSVRAMDSIYILVKNLPKRVSRKSIRDFFGRSKIAKKFDALHVEVDKDGGETGCALIEFESRRDQDHAMRLKRMKLEGKMIDLVSLGRKEYYERLDKSREYDKAYIEKKKKEGRKGDKDSKVTEKERNSVSTENGQKNADKGGQDDKKVQDQKKVESKEEKIDESSVKKDAKGGNEKDVRKVEEKTEKKDDRKVVLKEETKKDPVELKKVAPKKVEPKKIEPKKAEPNKVEPKKIEPKKAEPKKVEPTKIEPKKTEPKKVEPKKIEPKKAEPKKVEPKKIEPKKAEPQVVKEVKKEVQKDVKTDEKEVKDEPKKSWAEEVAEEEEKEQMEMEESTNNAGNEVMKEPEGCQEDHTCVSLDGIPFSAHYRMIYDFLRGVEVVKKGIHLIRIGIDKVAPICFVELANHEQVMMALKKDRTNVGNRFIRVQSMTKEVMMGRITSVQAKFGQGQGQGQGFGRGEGQGQGFGRGEGQGQGFGRGQGQGQGFGRGQGQGRGRGRGYGPGPGNPNMPNSPPQGCALIARNMSFRASPEDIFGMFGEFKPVREGIRIRYGLTGQPTGEALIPFHNPTDAEHALNALNQTQIFGRRLLLKLV